MLVFVDESGDLGFKLDRGSSRFFTIALVIFEDAVAALACERAIEELRQQLQLPPGFEFHFNHNSHARRLAFLQCLAQQSFSFFTLTLDKDGTQLKMPEFIAQPEKYQWICRNAFTSIAFRLDNAVITLDGSGHRALRQELRSYLRNELNIDGSRRVRDVRIRRSNADPLLQVADYAAGVVNRLYEDKEGAERYGSLIRRRWRGRTEWP